MTFSLRELACQCQKLQNIQTKDLYSAYLGMDRFNFFFKRSFRYENDDEKTKNETIVFFMKIVFKKMVVFKTIVFKKDHFLKTISILKS